MKIHTIINLSFLFCLSLPIVAMQQVVPSNIQQFFDAAKNNNLEQVQAFIDAGIDVNIQNTELPTRYTALHYAAEKNYAQLAKMLLENGAHVNITNQDQQTPLHIAAQSNSVNVAKVLLDYQPDVNARMAGGYTPLHVAVRYNSYEVVKLLLTSGYGIDVNAKDNERKTPFFYAPDEQVAELLSEHGAYINAYDPTIRDILYDMMLNGPVNDHIVVHFLIEYTPDQYIDINTPLLPLASTINYMDDIVELLLKKGINPNAKDENGNTALHLASNTGDNYADEKTELLLQYHADINARNNNGNTPLHMAIFNDYCDNAVALVLIDHGALINAKNNHGTTPLHMAMIPLPLDEKFDHEYKNTNIIKALIEHGADINAQNKNGDTPLHFGVKNFNRYNEEEKIERIKVLLENGAHMHIENNAGQTPIDLARNKNDKNLYKIFQDYSYKTLLLNSIVKNDLEKLQELINEGVNLNLKFTGGTTPLHFAILNNAEPQIIRLLLENGANLDIQNNEGKTPYQLAQETNNPEIIDLFDQQFQKNILQDLMFDEESITGHKHPRDNENDEEE